MVPDPGIKLFIATSCGKVVLNAPTWNLERDVAVRRDMMGERDSIGDGRH